MVKQNLIDIFCKEKYSKPAQKQYDTIKPVVKHFDITWFLDLVHAIVYVLKNKKG